ncbi:MAG: hypothetical protein A3F84_27820 [Candidatus Handelsmanbacteria bacterium RIFCSPLOWO2_12_FULL_64_10]|uniref:Uncharacterized protein n=1 Tax=Handelsmanbacteria sp. (strain RIFCSPLOWO2_12_FULL_64_10) TaxID=1817868 RepID=A0A1F6C517_HANXR|nr:MAG: hypothetical protein A3F84_27820 [Candidatus Handelsmanbacteria bacterium RIFCSPLOWO2_12_FULL_64_10]
MSFMVGGIVNRKRRLRVTNLTTVATVCKVNPACCNGTPAQGSGTFIVGIILKKATIQLPKYIVTDDCDVQTLSTDPICDPCEVRVASTAAGTLATDFENGDTVDGVTLATGDRILLKNQADSKENGVYTVNASGAPTRAIDLNSDSEFVEGMGHDVTEGTANADKVFSLTTPEPISVGTTNLAYAETTVGPRLQVRVKRIQVALPLGGRVVREACEEASCCLQWYVEPLFNVLTFPAAWFKPIVFDTVAMVSGAPVVGGAAYCALPASLPFNNTGTGGIGADATATLQDGVVTDITIRSAGSGYTSAPTVAFASVNNGNTLDRRHILVGGTGAAATVSISGGGVSAITLTNGGSGYKTTPNQWGATTLNGNGDSISPIIAYQGVYGGWTMVIQGAVSQIFSEAPTLVGNPNAPQPVCPSSPVIVEAILFPGYQYRLTPMES